MRMPAGLREARDCQNCSSTGNRVSSRPGACASSSEVFPISARSPSRACITYRMTRPKKSVRHCTRSSSASAFDLVSVRPARTSAWPQRVRAFRVSPAAKFRLRPSLCDGEQSFTTSEFPRYRNSQVTSKAFTPAREKLSWRTHMI